MWTPYADNPSNVDPAGYDVEPAATLDDATEPYICYTVDELRTLDFPEPQWLVEGMLPTGALVLLVGRPKAGKSLLAIDLMASVALREPFLGRETKQGPALYFHAEDAVPLVRQRLDARLAGATGVPLAVAPADGSIRQQVRLDGPETFTRLGLTLHRNRPRVVVLDPFRELHQFDENAADQMAYLLRPLRTLAHTFGTLIVLVHHRNKYATDPALASRGSTAITGSVDIVVTLETTANQNGIELDSGGTPGQSLKVLVEGRYGPPLRLAARLGEGLRWEPAESQEVTRSPRQRILEVLPSAWSGGKNEGEDEREDDAWLSGDEIAEATGLGLGQVRNELTRLFKAGQVIRAGTGGRGNPYRYRLAEPDAEEGDETEPGADADAERFNDLIQQFDLAFNFEASDDDSAALTSHRLSP